MNTETSTTEAAIVYHLVSNGEHASIAFELLEQRFFSDVTKAKIFAIGKNLHEKNLFEQNVFWDQLKSNGLFTKAYSPFQDNKEFLEIWEPSMSEESFRKAVAYIREQYAKRSLTLGVESMNSDQLRDLLTHNFENNKSVTAQNLDDVLAESMALDEDVCPFPWPSLNRFLHGVRRREYVVVAAMSGIGKSLFLEHMFWNAPRLKRKALFVSLEMGEDEIFKRQILRETGFDLFHQSVAKNKKIELYEKIKDQFGENIIITGQLTADQIDKQVAEFKPDLVLVDYVQTIAGNGKLEEYEQVTRASKAIKAMTDKYNAAFIVAAQIRKLERKVKQPTLFDIKSSGQIAHDADIVFTLWKKESNELELCDKTLLDCVKNRHGKVFCNSEEFEFGFAHDKVTLKEL